MTTLLDLFRERVGEHGDRIAWRHRGTTHTYTELDEASDQLAIALAARGVTQGDLVGLCLNRSPEIVTAILALLKLGAAYVAAEPWLPAGRRRRILTDSQPVALLLSPGADDGHPDLAVPRIRTDEIARGGDLPPPAPSTPDDLCHVVYTSGTTGIPKGVAISHGSVLNRLAWMWRAHPFPPGSVVLTHKTYGMVAAPWELLGGLLAGVPTLQLDPEDLLDPASLVPTLAERGVTHLFLTPHLVRVLIQSKVDNLTTELTPHLVTTSADVLPAGLARRFRAVFPETRLLNLYGLTECSSNVAAYDLADLPEEATAVPVGTPVAGATITLLDRAGRPVPRGVQGEIWVSGPVLALGYWRKPEQTAARFVTDRTGRRLFRTGDLGRWLRTGALEVRGRLDNQVKVRGFRVEPEEVEAVLAEADGVREIAVGAVTGTPARDTDPAEPRLVAGLVGTADLDTVRGHARRVLPDYLVPAEFVRLDELPRNANGKVDRPALAKVLADRHAEAAPPARAGSFQPGPEESLAKLWHELLGTPPEGPEENFFEAGGHSLLAVRFIGELGNALGTPLSLRDFYANPTVAGLAGRVAAGKAG